jgi:hypothetical protein
VGEGGGECRGIAIMTPEDDGVDGVEKDGEGDPGEGLAKVVHGKKATNYVGATHFMAILEDVRVDILPPLSCSWH